MPRYRCRIRLVTTAEIDVAAASGYAAEADAMPRALEAVRAALAAAGFSGAESCGALDEPPEEIARGVISCDVRPKQIGEPLP